MEKDKEIIGGWLLQKSLLYWATTAVDSLSWQNTVNI